MKRNILFIIIILLAADSFPQSSNIDTVFVIGEKPEIISQEEMWEREAEKDISEGKICLIAIAGFEPFVEYKKQFELFHKYGFEVSYMGCVRPQPGYKAYNKKMFEYLEKRNGEGWYLKFQKEYQDLLSSEREKNKIK